MTVQCVNDKMRIVLAASYLKMLESVPDYVDAVLKTMAGMGASGYTWRCLTVSSSQLMR